MRYPQDGGFTLKLHRQQFHPRPCLLTMTTQYFSPGTIASSLPAVLGFFPRNSLVLVGFTHVESTNENHESATRTLSSGPVIRIDLDALTEISEVALQVDSISMDLFFGFIISEDVQEFDAYNLASDRWTADTPLVAVWSAAEITGGETLRLDYVDASHSAAPTIRSRWNRCTIPPLEHSESMRGLVSRGLLPELSREEFIRQFERNEQLVPTRESELWSWMIERKVAGYEVWDPGSNMPHTLVAHCLDTLDTFPHECDIADIATETDFMELLGSCLAHKRMRDMLIIEVGNPESARIHWALFAAAQVFSGTIRANALALLALDAAARQWMTIVPTALMYAQREDPHHTLADLLFTAYMNGILDESLERCSTTARQLCSEAGIERVRCGGGTD